MKYVIDKTTLDDIGNAIRTKTGKTDLIKVEDLDTEILDISAGASINLYVQEDEPTEKEGIWVQSTHEYENKSAVDNVLNDEGASYTKLIDIPYSFSSGSAVLVGTDIHLLGSSNSSYYKYHYKYDTLTNTYTRLTDIPYNFYYGSAVLVGTNIHILGGTGGATYHYKYDTLTGTYTKLANIPYQFYQGSAVAIGTDIHILGSINSSSYKYHYKYDTLTGTYIKLANIPYSFYEGSAVAIGTDIHILGGYSNSSYKYHYKYDTLTDTYTRLTDIPYDFYDGQVVSVSADIHILGGGSTYHYKYDTLTDTYTKLTNIPYQFYQGSAVLAGIDIHLLGGTNVGQYHYIYSMTINEAIPDNSVIIEQGVSTYRTILFNSDFTNGLQYKFNKIWLKDEDGNVDNTTKRYYGNETEWIQIGGV